MTKKPQAESNLKHSSTGKEMEMRREITRTEAEARAAHRATDIKDHPAFRGRQPDTRG
jgi:hypothetical protein